MVRAVSRPLLVVVFAFATSACSHAGGTAATTPSPVASATATAVPSAAASVDYKRVNYSKNGVDASVGTGTEADLAAIGLPVYPTMRVQDTFVIKHVDKHKSAFTLQGSVKDDLPTVSAWYAQRLGPSFKASRITVLAGNASSFGRKTTTSVEYVFLQRQQDENTGVPLTTITLTVTKRR